MKTWRIARDWWLQWAPRSFWLGFSREWGESTFFGVGPFVFVYCPTCGAKQP